MGDIQDWRLVKRYTYQSHSLFKMKQISQNTVIAHIPSAKRINFYDLQLTPAERHLTFSAEMQGIEHLQIEGRDFILAGLKNGVIEGKQMVNDSDHEQEAIELKIDSQLGQNVYINDMLYLDQGKLINCYNSGSLAIWDVTKIQSQTSPLSYLRSVHEDYIYKIRKVSDNQVVTCGNDQFTNIIDLETAAVVESYHHPEPVWCCYPIDSNTLCSAGLFGCLLFRDIRVGKLVQILKLETFETSFVTRLDFNHLVFGDRKKISRCDMRKMERHNHCPAYCMRASAQNILVTPAGGIVVGRGGDMCLFETGGEQGVPEERKLKFDNTNYSSEIENTSANFFANFLANHLQGNVLVEDEENDEDALLQWEDEEEDSDDEIM